MFFKYTSELAASSLDMYERNCMMVIAGLQGPDGAWPSNSYLATFCEEQTTPSYISRVLTRLVVAGFITRKGGRNSRRLYLTDAGRALFPASSVSEGEVDVAPSPSPKAPKEKTTPNKNPTVAEHCARELPEWFPKDVWAEFVAMRHKEHGPFSENIAKGVVGKVTKLRGEGQDPAKLLHLAIERCWMTVFADKDGTTKAGAAPSLTGDRRSPGSILFDGHHVRIGARKKAA
jgi:hypothetical protein